MMLLKSTCPHCQATVRVKEDHVSKHVRCPACKRPFEVKSVELATAPSIGESKLASETITDELSDTQAADVSGSKILASERLGRFQLREVLGQGAFGRVYRAYDPQLDREVALKVPIFGTNDTKRVRRFLTEAKAAAKLRHPNIVPVYESGEVEGRYFIAAQFVSGQTLAARIEAGEVRFREAAEWVRALADALAYAHGEGIVHRDIKPENILLDAKNQPQIMDFGLAKRTSDEASMTVDGSVLGTPAYMSPEQARGDQAKVGPLSDQYSLGAVLYELLTGKRPFEGAAHSVVAKVIAEEPASIRSLRTNVPRDLEAICQKAMSKEIASRYASTQELAADLTRWLGDAPILARPIGYRERLLRWARREPRVAGLAGAIVLVLILGASVSTWFAIRAQENAHHLTLALDQANTERERADDEAASAKTAQAASKLAEKAAQEREQDAIAAREEARHSQEAAEKNANELAATLKKLKTAEDTAKESDTVASTATFKADQLELERLKAVSATNILAAKEALRAKDFAKARTALDGCDERFRDAEWIALNQRATLAKASKLVHTSEVPFRLFTMRWSEKVLLVESPVGKEDPELQVLDANTTKILRKQSVIRGNPVLVPRGNLIRQDGVRDYVLWYPTRRYEIHPAGDSVVVDVDKREISIDNGRGGTPLPSWRFEFLGFLGRPDYDFNLLTHGSAFFLISRRGEKKRVVIARLISSTVINDVEPPQSWQREGLKDLELFSLDGVTNSIVMGNVDSDSLFLLYRDNPLDQRCHRLAVKKPLTELGKSPVVAAANDFAAVAFPDRIEIWHATGEEPVATIPIANAQALALSPKGEFIAASVKGGIEVAEIKSAKVIATLATASPVEQLQCDFESRLYWVEKEKADGRTELRMWQTELGSD